MEAKEARLRGQLAKSSDRAYRVRGCDGDGDGDCGDDHLDDDDNYDGNIGDDDDHNDDARLLHQVQRTPSYFFVDSDYDDDHDDDEDDNDDGMPLWIAIFNWGC